MRIRTLLVLLVTLPSVGPPAEGRPNILIVLPDQMRAQALGCMENPDARTPNLDRLAAGRLLFHNAFANTPVWWPARATILTGKYAQRNAMVPNAPRPLESGATLAQVLPAADGPTRFIG